MRLNIFSKSINHQHERLRCIPMNLKQLRYFVTICEEGQITAAAKRLHIKQPLLSYEIKQLELELETSLFIRGPRGISLTDAGKVLKPYAEQITELSDVAKTKVKYLDKGISGSLSIGSISSSINKLPNQRLLKLKKYYPNIAINVIEGNTYKLLGYLEKGLIDLAILRTPFSSKGVIGYYFDKEPMVAVSAKNNQKDTVGLPDKYLKIDDLSNKPLIIYRRFEELIENTFRNLGFNPLIVVRCDDARTALDWAKVGFGTAIVPKSAILQVENEGEKDIEFREIKEKALETQLAIMWRRDDSFNPLTENFLKMFIGK
ncbi:Transcriptional regulator, LysR family [Oenococcus oeni]|nr:Transcriptional regulator, LysR family [Oenococcus oeni]SYW11247.1 Transcriptional regulator, LysR family [Oenococcus oeni]SYW14812.1 Transcriptional regulator, LysR family [Oenococcus oeni]SYW15645.1 Transcriptional regulator, LysR family [Oenococcus oeni]